MSLIKTLNKKVPRIDQWGTPLWMSAQLLSTMLTLICKISKERPNEMIYHMLAICQAICHEIGSQTPSRDPSILQLHIGFNQGLHASLPEVRAVWFDIHGHVSKHIKRVEYFIKIVS